MLNLCCELCILRLELWNVYSRIHLSQRSVYRTTFLWFRPYTTCVFVYVFICLFMWICVFVFLSIWWGIRLTVYSWLINNDLLNLTSYRFSSFYCYSVVSRNFGCFAILIHSLHTIVLLIQAYFSTLAVHYFALERIPPFQNTT